MSLCEVDDDDDVPTVVSTDVSEGDDDATGIAVIELAIVLAAISVVAAYTDEDDMP